MKFFQISFPSPLPKYPQLLQSMSSKSSPLDYIPISLLKSCTGTYLPTLLIHPHLTLGKPFFHTGYFSIQIQTSFLFALASCSPQNKFQDSYYHFQSSPVPTAILHISPLLFLGMCQHDHCDLLLLCHYVVRNRKTGMAQSRSFSSVASSVWNKNPQVIFHPFPLFPFSGRDSSTIFFECLSQ